MHTVAIHIVVVWGLYPELTATFACAVVFTLRKWHVWRSDDKKGVDITSKGSRQYVIPMAHEAGSEYLVINTRRFTGPASYFYYSTLYWQIPAQVENILTYVDLIISVPLVHWCYFLREKA